MQKLSVIDDLLLFAESGEVDDDLKRNLNFKSNLKFREKVVNS
jgi:hypothetical protein